MNSTNVSRRGPAKTALIALAMICVSALIFGYFSQTVLAADLNRPETIPTSYPAAPAAAPSAPTGYEKADYTVAPDPLLAEPAGSQALTAAQAAELGAQALWQLYGLDLEGATIYMGYCSGTETFPRAFWAGDVRFGADRTPENPGCSFRLDAVTGERFSAVYARILDAEVPLGLDKALAENPQEYLELARRTAAEQNIVHGEVDSVVYNCQGYANNDPDITLEVLGVNGEKASLTFSRYDQQLTAVGYDAERRVREPAQQKLGQELEKQAEAARACAPAGSGGALVSLAG